MTWDGRPVDPAKMLADAIAFWGDPHRGRRRRGNRIVGTMPSGPNHVLRAELAQGHVWFRVFAQRPDGEQLPTNYGFRVGSGPEFGAFAGLVATCLEILRAEDAHQVERPRQLAHQQHQNGHDGRRDDDKPDQGGNQQHRDEPTAA